MFLNFQNTLPDQQGCSSNSSESPLDMLCPQCIVTSNQNGKEVSNLFINKKELL